MRAMEIVPLPVGALRNPDFVCSRALAANTHEEITVPASACFVVFSATASADFYAAYGANPTAVVPGDVDDGTSNELNPTLRYIKGVAKISVISAASAGCIVTAAFYEAQ